MTLRDMTRWNVRVSLVYAIGIWTMLGTYGFFHLKKKRELATLESNATETTEVPGQPELEEDITSMPHKQPAKEAVSTTVVVKEGFVPHSSRIYTYGKSVFGASSESSIEK
ncbi:small integral membrane protein 26-like [Mustelus asterias]